MSKYTSMTLRFCEKYRWPAGVVERYLVNGNKRIDLFGIIDIIAIQNNETIGIQSTGPHGIAEHLKTIVDHPMTTEWLNKNRHLILIAWRKLKFRRKNGSWSKVARWTPRVFTFYREYGFVRYQEQPEQYMNPLAHPEDNPFKD